MLVIFLTIIGSITLLYFFPKYDAAFFDCHSHICSEMVNLQQ